MNRVTLILTDDRGIDIAEFVVEKEHPLSALYDNVRGYLIAAAVRDEGRHGHAGFYTAACSDCRQQITQDGDEIHDPRCTLHDVALCRQCIVVKG